MSKAHERMTDREAIVRIATAVKNYAKYAPVVEAEAYRRVLSLARECREWRRLASEWQNCKKGALANLAEFAARKATR